MPDSPYQPSPPSQSPPVDPTPASGQPSSPPPVWRWYLVYCALMTLLYVACAGFGIFALVFGERLAEGKREDEIMLMVQGIMFLIIGIPLATLFAAVFFLPRKKPAWIVGFVTIGIGLTSPCCLPISIPLLIFWLKPETKAFFRVG